MIRRLSLLLALVALLAIAFAPATAAGVTVGEKTRGNPPCAGTKIDPVRAGSHALKGGGHIVIELVDTAGGETFNFDTEGSATVSLVTVKGGPYFLNYIFSPAVEEWDGLHAPFNSNSKKWYGLSHLCIESAKKG